VSIFRQIDTFPAWRLRSFLIIVRRGPDGGYRFPVAQTFRYNVYLPIVTYFISSRDNQVSAGNPRKSQIDSYLAHELLESFS